MYEILNWIRRYRSQNVVAKAFIFCIDNNNIDSSTQYRACHKHSNLYRIEYYVQTQNYKPKHNIIMLQSDNVFII